MIGNSFVRCIFQRVQLYPASQTTVFHLNKISCIDLLFLPQISLISGNSILIMKRIFYYLFF